MRNPYVPQQLPLENLDYNNFVSLLSEANRNVARYDGLLGSIQNKYVFLSPLITQEAVLSSVIEGTQATFQEVLEFEADESKFKDMDKRNDILEIKNYRAAMNHAVKRFGEIPLFLRLIKEVHEILMSSVRGMNKSPGEFRKVQNWIGKPGCTMEDATFIPPSPEKLPDYLSNLEKYMNDDDKDYIVQAAIIHAQFEILHPFLDGNGRIGRMLIPLFLFTKGVMSDPVFYISSYMEEKREEYYYNLNRITGYGD
ncbi:MAG: Cell filamentation protein Fic [Firmicutes bacterium]|nr:Cell filamentation protein Fic [Bacillota bacterium]